MTIADHILLTTQPIEGPNDAAHFRSLLGMFSSDFLHWDGDTPDFAARTFPAALRTRVMAETTREIYKLPAAAPARALAEATHD